jgi:hypothetical protein
MRELIVLSIIIAVYLFLAGNNSKVALACPDPPNCGDHAK